VTGAAAIDGGGGEFESEVGAVDADEGGFVEACCCEGAGPICSSPGTEFNFASRTASRISTSVILFDNFDIFCSIVSVNWLKKVAVFAMKLFTSNNVFGRGTGFI
jgi:hypothetical protein